MCNAAVWTQRPCDATELNSDGMMKSGDVHYQSPTEFINFSERDLINDDSIFCSHNSFSKILTCSVMLVLEPRKT